MTDELKTVTLATTVGIPSGTIIETPPGLPNIVVKTRSPLERIVTRIARVYIQALVGFLPVTMGAGQAIANQIAPGKLVLPTEFGAQLLLAAALALAPSVTALFGNLLEFLIKRDSEA